MRLLGVACLALLLALPWRAGSDHPCVIVVTIDSLRADAAEGMPRLQAFLREATRFAGARTVAPITLTAHVSLMTGLMPSGHGIHDNVTPPLPGKRPFTLLAEEFSEAGYATAAFVASDVLAPATGIAAGFGRYDAPDGELTAEERLPAALEWLRRRNPARPFFLWLHLFDPHAPYGELAGHAESRTPREQYAAEVRRADEGLGRLLEALPRAAIVVVASDHGEGLGDHGEATHGPLCFASVVDAVLAVRAPALAAGAVDRSPRSLVDVAPSLRRWCGLRTRPTGGAALDEPAARGRIVVTESLYAWRMHGWGQAYAATDGRFTLVEAGATLALYDLRRDPREEQPLDPGAEVTGERLEQALTAYRSGGSPSLASDIGGGVGSPYGMARAPRTAYLSRRGNAKLVDPRERLRYWEVLSTASQLISRGSDERDPFVLRRALGMLSALVEEDPADPAPHTYRAHAMKLLASITGARHWLRDASAATRAAIERGYATEALLQDAIRLSRDSGDAVEIEATRRLAGGPPPSSASRKD